MAQTMLNITYQKLIQYHFVDLELMQIYVVSYFYCEERRSVERTPFVWSNSVKDVGQLLLPANPEKSRYK